MRRSICSSPLYQPFVASLLSKRGYTTTQNRSYRWSSTFSCSNDDNSNESSDFVDPFLKRHLSRNNIDERLHSGIVAALEPVYGKPLTVSHLKSFGSPALEALAKSVQDNLPPVDENAASLQLAIDIPHHSTTYQNIEWHEGISLLQLCKSHPDMFGEYMEGTCGGSMSCCTCHVYLSERMFESLPEPSEAELDMLDLAYHVKETSRLACQVYVHENMLTLPPKDLVVTLPADVNDLWS